MKILVIIPAYNEELNIPYVIDDLRKNAPFADILAVNDCSFDKTDEVLTSLGVNHLNLCVNLGIGGAVQAGFKYAVQNDYDICIQFDGDGQHDARYIKDLIVPIETENADMVIGSRFIDKEGFQSSAMRRVGINFLSSLCRSFGKVDVKDVTSGFRAFSRRMFTFFAERYAQDYPEPEAVMVAGVYKANIKEVPVEMRARQNGESSISSFGSAYYMIKVSLALIFTRIFMDKGRKL